MANKDKVTIKGGDLDGSVLENAATEKTLERLVEVLEGKKKGSGDKVKKLHQKAVEENTKAFKDLSSGTNEYYRDLAELDKKTKGFKDTVASISGMALGTTFSLMATAGKSLAGFFLDGFDALKETNKVGAGFNNSITELRRAAANAAMPLDMFVETVQKNSQALAALGGTVSEGAKQFGVLSKDFRESEVGQQLQMMGYTVGDLNDALADQMEIDMRAGKLRGKDGATLRKETEQLTMDLDKLAKATGLNRQELEKNLKKAARDGRALALQQKLTGGALVNFKENLALMNTNFDPDIANTLTNMMSGFIDPADQFGRTLEALAPGTMAFEEAIGRGALSAEQAIDGYRKQSSALTKYLSQFSKQAIAARPDLKRMEEYNAQLQNLIDANTGEAGKQQKAQSQITKALGTFSEFINKLFGDILVEVVDSPVFKDLEKTLESLAKVFNDNKGKITNVLMPMINGFLSVVNDMLKGFTAFLSSNELTADNVADYFMGVFKTIGEGISKAMGAMFSSFSDSPERKAKKEAYARATPEEKQRMEAEDPSLKTSGIFDTIKKGFDSLISLIPSLTDIALFFGVTAGGAVVAGMGIAAGITLVGEALGKLAVTISSGVSKGMFALAEGMTAMAPSALALGGAIGIGSAGLGFAFQGLASIIKEITDIFPKLTTFFKSMIEMDPAKLSNAGTALTPLADNLLKLAKGGVLGLIGGGGLESLASALTKMGDVDAKKITDVGPALQKLHEGLVVFNDQSFWDTLSSSLKEFASGKGLESVTASLTSLGKVDISKLESITSLSGLLDNLKPFLDANLVQKLPESMDKVKDTLASFTNGITEVVAKISPTLLQPITGMTDSLTKLAGLDLSKLDANKNVLTSFSDVITKFSGIDSSKFDKNIVGALTDTISKISQIDVSAATKTVAEISKVNTTISDSFATQAKGVDDYIKSIDNLTVSLTKLEKQLNDMPKVTTASATDTGGGGRTVVASGSPTAESSAEDLQRQLNSKVDDLITHIVEMKQNTKDTADSISGRRSAV